MQATSKLTELLESLLTKRLDLMKQADESRAILNEPDPPAHDADAALRTVAAALAYDAAHGTDTAEAIKAEIRVAKDAATTAQADYQTRRTDAEKHLARCTEDARALLIQIDETDKAIRDEVATAATAMLEKAERKAAQAAAALIQAMTEVNAIGLVASARAKGHYGGQFNFHARQPITVDCPKSGRGLLPDGYGVNAGQGSSITYGVQAVTHMSEARARVLMHEQTGGAWPECMEGFSHE